MHKNICSIFLIQFGLVISMKFAFQNISNSEIYKTAKVLFVTGQYDIFNNIVIDSVKDICRPIIVEDTDRELFDNSEFEDDNSDDDIVVSNSIDIDTFMKVNNISPASGKWFCNVNYEFMSKKQKDWLDRYMKDPSDNGKLVVCCREYKDYKQYLKHKIILNSTNIHLIQLNFPNRRTLESLVRLLFNNNGVEIEESAIELFIMRMSSSYDKYGEVIDKIISESVPIEHLNKNGQVDDNWKYTITYDDTFNAMKGIENFVLDDLLAKLLVPIKSDKLDGRNNKVFRMLDSLMKEMGPRQLVNKLRYKIDDYIEFRLAINSGVIPIRVKFSVPEAKERLGDSSRLSKLSDYTFRKMAIIASQTSLKDWLYMKMLLSNIFRGAKDEDYERVLHTIITRTTLTESRINNDIGIENILSIGIDELDDIHYTESKLLYNKEVITSE